MDKKLIIWGAGGHASVVADIVRLGKEYDLVGFLDDVNPGRRASSFLGKPVLGGAEQLRRLWGLGVRHVLLGFGDGKARLAQARRLAQFGLRLATAVHPSAVVASGVRIGPGTVIMAGAVVNPGTRIGRNVIINTCASVDHHCRVGDGAHICPGVRLAGHVSVGRGSWVGIGSVVIDHIKIGSGTYVGAGAVVVDDLPDNVVAYGVPARVVREVGDGTP
jgi:UDP-N-acetylbacillosamine N-acetyltransferase